MHEIRSVGAAPRPRRGHEALTDPERFRTCHGPRQVPAQGARDQGLALRPHGL